jgi:hypothetical protein
MSRQKGYLTTRADAVATVQGECFCFQLYGRCPYGDTELVIKAESTRMSTNTARQ